MSTSNLTSIIRCVVIIAAVWLGSIPAAEGVFRLAGDQPSPDMRGLFAPFADGDYKLGASVDTYAFYAQGRVTISTDELGLRCDGARHLAAKPGDAVDTLLLGDSQGFGNGVDFEDSIAGSLAEIEVKRGYRVSNASVGGHSLASQYEVAKWLVDSKDLKPANFVLLLTPVMINTGDKLDHAVVGRDGRLYSGTAGLSTLVNLWMKTHLVLYSRVRDAVRNYGIGVQPAAKSAVFDYYQAGPHTDAVRQDLQAIVGKIQAFAAKHGASLELVYVPLTVEADFAPVSKAAAAVGMTLDPDVSLKIESDVADRLHIPLYDLKPVLQKIHEEGQQLNVKGDYHYSPVLSRACGSSLAANLKFSSTDSQLTANQTRR